MAQYSHRNGETDLPTVAGHYGVRVAEDAPFKDWGDIYRVVIEDGKAWWLKEPHYDYCDDLPVGRYWGPLTGPWEEDNATQ